jgi:hypothetical protein
VAAGEQYEVLLVSRGERPLEGSFVYIGVDLPPVEAVIPVYDLNDRYSRVRARVIRVDGNGYPPITAQELYTVRALG